MFSSDLGEFFSATSCKGTQFLRSVNSSATHNSDLLHMTTSSAVVSPLVTVEQHRLPHQIELRLSSSPGAAPTDSSGQEQMYHRSDYHYTRTDGHSAPTSSPTPTGLTTVWSRPRAPVHPPTDSLSSSTSAEHAPVHSSTVSQHASTHSAASRGILRCPFCNKSFSNSSAIAKHKLTHSEERKYVCSICHKAFKRQDHLNGHKYTHEDKKPHGCCFCDKSYSDARSLRRHYENAHPLEYERWLALSQATHGDTTAIAAAAAALLSSTTTTVSTGVDPDAAVAGNSGPVTSTNPSAAASLLNVLSNPMCKLFASLGRPDGSPASSATNEGQRSNGHSKSRHPHDKGHRQKRRTPHGMEWSSAGSSHSSNSCGGSASNASSPSGTIMDIGDHDEELEDRLDKSNPLAALSSISAEDISTAAKVALLMAHPLEAPKRVACAICQKRFKNQSALNGHMRLHGGYGPAGLTAPTSSTTTCVNTKTGAPNSSSAVEESHCGAEETIHDTHLTVSLSQPPSGSTKAQNPGENGSVLSHNLPTEFSGFNPIAHGVSNLTSRNSLRVSEVYAHIRADDTTPAPAQPPVIATRADDSWLASRYSSLPHSVHQRASNRIPPEFSHSNLFADPRPSRPQPTPPPCYPPTHPGRSSTISESTWFTDNHLLGRDKSVPRSSSGPNLHSGPSTTSGSSTYPNQHGLVNAKIALRDCTDSHAAHLCDATHLEPARVATMCTRREELTGSSFVGPKALDTSVHTLPAAKGVTTGDIWSKRQSPGFYDPDPTAHRLGCGAEPHIAGQRGSISAFTSALVSKPEVTYDPPSNAHRSSFVRPEWSSAPRNGEATRFTFNFPAAPHFCPQTGLSDQYSPVTPAPGNSNNMGVDCSADSSDTAFHFPPDEQHVRSSTELGHYLSSTHLSDPVASEQTISGLAYTGSTVPAIRSKWSKQPAKMHHHHHFAAIRQSNSAAKLAELPYGRSSMCGYRDAQASSYDASDSLVDILDLLNHRPHVVGTHPVLTTVAPVAIPHSQYGMIHGAPRASIGDTVDHTSNSAWSVSRSTAWHGSHAFGQCNMSNDRTPTVPASHTYTPDVSVSIPIVPVGRDSHYISSWPSSSSSGMLHESHSFPNASYHSRSFDSIDSADASAPCTHAIYRPSRFNTNTSYVGGASEPERTRHISAPVIQPCVFSYSSSSISQVTSRSGGSLSHLTTAHRESQHGSYNRHTYQLAASEDSSDIAPFSVENNDLSSSDAVADLLMQSHITDTLTVSGPSSIHLRQGDNALLLPLRIDADYANQRHCHDVQSTSMVTTTSGSASGLQAHGLHQSGGFAIAKTSALSSNECATSIASAVEEFELADLSTGSAGGVDDLDNQLTVSNLSKSLAEENLFRNPHTIPPPKKQKRKPAPIFIPPQTGANLSRLRSPRVWTSDGTTTNPSPPPYTPPPMLSPNRPGSGLFSSLTKWCSTVSPVRPGALFNRRSSSHCPSSAVSASSDLLRRRSNISSTRVHSLNTCDEPEGTSLKRNYTSSFVRSSNAQIAGSTYSSRDSVDEHGRVFAFSSRRHRKTPKSAPVVMLDSSSIAAPSHSSQEHAPDASCELPAISKTGATTVFGYDDETMRRFAEADAADRARWYQTVPRDPSDPLIDYPECLSSGLDEVPEKLCKLEQPDGDTSMNYQSEDALVLVEDPLAVLDERAIEMGAYVDEDQLMEDEEEEEEGVPSSLVPRINIGDAFQAEIPELSTARASDLEKNTEPRETLLWYPANLDEKDPKNIESLNLLMKIACSPAVRSCGLNMEYTFHLLCKYKGNLEMALHALLYETLVVYDYVYAETTAWTTEEIARFQHGLRVYGRDFHQVAKDLQAMGINKTVKACVEFYYVWKRMNTPSDVKWYREKARRQRLASRSEAPPPKETSFYPTAGTEPDQPHHNASEGISLPERLPEPSYNLRRKHIQPPTTHAQPMCEDRPSATELSIKDKLSTSEMLPISASMDLAGVGTTASDTVHSHEKLNDSFPCHLCHRVFAKVKSRNAHMKSHTDRGSVANHRAPTNHGH